MDRVRKLHHRAPAFLALACATVILGACGLKGPLEMPAEDKPVPPPAAASPATSAVPAKPEAPAATKSAAPAAATPGADAPMQGDAAPSTIEESVPEETSF